MQKPIVNKIRCKKYHDMIESKHTHDFQYCKCKSIFLDGGTEYQRYGWKNGKLEDYIDFSYSEYDK